MTHSLIHRSPPPWIRRMVKWRSAGWPPRFAWSGPPGLAGRPGTRLGRNQVADEDEGLAGRDRVPGPPVAVGQIGRDDQLAAAADLHALDALVPARDDPPGAEPERERLTPVPARVEFLAGRVSHPDVVDLDHVARGRLLAVAFPNLGDLEIGGRVTAGEVDLGLAGAHARLSVARHDRRPA